MTQIKAETSKSILHELRAPARTRRLHFRVEIGETVRAGRLCGGLGLLGLKAVQVVNGALRVGSGLEDSAVIVLQNLEPRSAVPTCIARLIQEFTPNKPLEVTCGYRKSTGGWVDSKQGWGVGKRGRRWVSVISEKKLTKKIGKKKLKNSGSPRSARIKPQIESRNPPQRSIADNPAD